jgi:predicted ATPase
MDVDQPILLSCTLRRDRVEDFSVYPFNIPAIASLEHGLALDAPVTYFVGENGSGKSTLIEALAVAAGFNPEGGTMDFNFSTRSSESSLHRALRLVRSIRRPRTGFFLRAESFFNVATEIEKLGVGGAYGSRLLHEQSHGESFNGRFRDECLAQARFPTLARARVEIERWRVDYNCERPHSAVGYRTPKAFGDIARRNLPPSAGLPPHRGQRESSR